MAMGGVAQPLILDQLRGPAAAPIDYDKLVRAFQGVNLSVSVRDTDAAAGRKKFTDNLSNG
ncbi:hypothetical protein GCM10027422_28590 [Hymenobacter arcticus]